MMCLFQSWNDVSFPVVQCSRLKAPHKASLRCDNPLGEHSYGSTCTVQCNKGFDLIGTNMTECSSQGQWRSGLPVCQGKTTRETIRTLFCSGCSLSLQYVRQAVMLLFVYNQTLSGLSVSQSEEVQSNRTSTGLPVLLWSKWSLHFRFPVHRQLWEGLCTEWNCQHWVQLPWFVECRYTTVLG